MLVYASVCAILLLAGLGEAKKYRPTAYKSINEITVTHIYSGWGNAADACFQLGLMPLYLSKENRRAAGKALRNAGKRHGWVQAVRYEGKWVSKRLKLQLPASARKLTNRELKEGEKGEVVEETNPDVVHVTLCEKPGSHRRGGYRRHRRDSRHRRYHRHHHRRHARRHDRSRDRRSYSLDRSSDDYARSRQLSTDSSRRSYNRSADSYDRRGRRGSRRGSRRGGRRTAGWLGTASTDTEGYNRRHYRDRSGSQGDERSYERDDRRRRSRRGNRDSSVSSDRRRSRRHSSYSDEDTRDDSRRRSYSDDSSRSRRHRRSRRSRSRHSSKRRGDKKGSHTETKGTTSTSGGYSGDPSKCPMKHLLEQPNRLFI